MNIQKLRGLVAAFNNTLGALTAVENQTLAVHRLVAAQDLSIQTLRGLIVALNNMLGGPATGEDVGDGVTAIARGLDIHALRGLIVTARNQDGPGIDAETLEYLEELVKLL